MHLSRLLVFSVAAAGVATATSVCNKENAQPLPESALVHYAKFDLALQEIYTKALEKAGHWKRDRSQLLGRQAGSMFCTESETCFNYAGSFFCYTEETTVLRYEADMLFNLKTGDVTLSHGLEANVYTNPSWMVDAFKRRVERMYGTVPAEFRTLNASARIAYLASMSATTSIVTTAPPSVTATGPIATLTTTVSAPTSTASGDSAAGELVVGGSWVAAVAALAAAIVV